MKHHYQFLSTNNSEGSLQSARGSYLRCIEDASSELMKDLTNVKPDFKSIPLQFCFEIAGLASAKTWRKIQNIDEEKRF